MKYNVTMLIVFISFIPATTQAERTPNEEKKLLVMLIITVNYITSLPYMAL